MLKKFTDFFSMNTDAGYMPQLNTLRAIAVFMVICNHWLPQNNPLQKLPLSSGVTLFFVLSGFLITKILLNSRDKNELQSGSKFHVTKQFYIRRILRIFPIYYLTLFILYVFNQNDLRKNILWYLFYASNIFYFLRQNYDGSLSITWTLAVEEQFYLFWPFVILFIPRKYLFKSIVALTIFGPAYRAIVAFTQPGITGGINFAMILTPAILDSFGMGAILAYITLYKKGDTEFILSILRKFILLFSLILLYMILYKQAFIYEVFFSVCINIVSLFLISKASVGFTGITGKIFNNKFPVYLGQISYGLYLYHNFIPLLYSSLKLPPIINVPVRFMVYLLILLTIASVSWFFIEKPINSLKRFFNYTKPQTST